MNSNQSIFSVIFILLLGFTFNVNAQWSLGELNLAHQYAEDAEIRLVVNPSIINDSLDVLVSIQLNQDKSEISDYTFDFFMQYTYQEKLSAPIAKSKIDSVYLGSNKNLHLLKFKFKYSKTPFLFVRVQSKFSGFTLYYDIPITESIDSHKNLLFQNNYPIVKNFLNTGRYSFMNDGFVNYYNFSFNHGLPPMMTRAQLPYREMLIDSVYKSNENQVLNLSKRGLYYFQTDTSSSFGYGLRLEGQYFPKLATLQQLKEPLVYITTKEEKATLDSMDSKRSFDKFWLDLTESPERAKRIINRYYDRVELANELFTTFKEGWKTDRGMIFIVFGPPEEVIKTKNEEIWVYMQNIRLPKIKFRFIKAQNIFSSSHYVLIREKKYDHIWFTAVDLWRKGRF